MREQQSKRREKIMAALTTALDAEQVEALKRIYSSSNASSNASAVGRVGVETVRRAVDFSIFSAAVSKLPSAIAKRQGIRR